MANDYRYKLVKTWFLTLNRAGMSKELGDEFLQSIYPGKSVSRLTTDELYNVLYNLVKKTGLDIGIPKQTQRPQKKKAWNKPRDIDDRTELASPGQMELLENYAEAVGLSDSGLMKLWKRVGEGYTGPMTVIIAQKMIEAMKAMQKRGWKPTRQQIEEKIPPGVLLN